MALLLTVNRHTNKAYIRTRDFNFSLSGLTGFDLHGKTVGIVGTGKIGRTFSEICKGFGMRILAYDKFPSPDNGLSYVPLLELLAQLLQGLFLNAGDVAAGNAQALCHHPLGLGGKPQQPVAPAHHLPLPGGEG